MPRQATAARSAALRWPRPLPRFVWWLLAARRLPGVDTRAQLRELAGERGVRDICDFQDFCVPEPSRSAPVDSPSTTRFRRVRWGFVPFFFLLVMLRFPSRAGREFG